MYIFRHVYIPTRIYSDTYIFRHCIYSDIVYIPTRIYSDTHIFRHAYIPTRIYSDTYIFRHVYIPTLYIFRHCIYSDIVYIPTCIYSDMYIFRHVYCCKKPLQKSYSDMYIFRHCTYFDNIFYLCTSIREHTRPLKNIIYHPLYPYRWASKTKRPRGTSHLFTPSEKWKYEFDPLDQPWSLK